MFTPWHIVEHVINICSSYSAALGCDGSALYAPIIFLPGLALEPN